jgi:ribonuclease-3
VRRQRYEQGGQELADRDRLAQERKRQLQGLEECLGHRFAEPELLHRALTHASRTNEEPSLKHNEPLEFLGDSVLGFLVADLLHRQDPDGDEGAKSRARSHLVSASSLAKRAAQLGLPELLLLSRGEEKTGGRAKEALWANAYEAVIAALYLDGGTAAARRFVSAELGPDIEDGWPLDARDHKSVLQELLQGRGDSLPEYLVEAEDGPSHRPRFRVRCVVDGRGLSEGEGYSKKEAQQEAARAALKRLAAESGSGPASERGVEKP